MNNLTLLANRPKSTIKKLTKNSKIFKAIIDAIQEKKGENGFHGEQVIAYSEYRGQEQIHHKDHNAPKAGHKGRKIKFL